MHRQQSGEKPLFPFVLHLPAIACVYTDHEPFENMPDDIPGTGDETVPGEDSDGAHTVCI